MRAAIPQHPRQRSRGRADEASAPHGTGASGHHAGPEQHRESQVGFNVRIPGGFLPLGQPARTRGWQPAPHSEQPPVQRTHCRPYSRQPAGQRRFNAARWPQFHRFSYCGDFPLRKGTRSPAPCSGRLREPGTPRSCRGLCHNRGMGSRPSAAL